MNLISSQWDRLNRYSTEVFLSFVGLFLLLTFWNGRIQTVALIPIVMAFFVYKFWGTSQPYEVWDAGDRLVVKFRSKTHEIPLSNILDFEVSRLWLRGPTVVVCKTTMPEISSFAFHPWTASFWPVSVAQKNQEGQLFIELMNDRMKSTKKT